MASVVERKGPAVVVSAGRMQKTVKARQTKEVWNAHIRKSFFKPVHFLVHDPNSSILEGDVITTIPERRSKHVHYTVTSIVAPFGKPIDERPPILTNEQREALADEKRKAKVQRRAARGISSAVHEARRRGWEYTRNRPADDPERPKDALNRSVLPGGLHKFGGKGEGGIHKEAMEGANKTLKRYEKAKQHEAERDEVESQPAEDITKERLEGKR